MSRSTRGFAVVALLPFIAIFGAVAIAVDSYIGAKLSAIQSSQLAAVIETTSKGCDAAKKAAIAGKNSGTQSAGSEEISDKCIAAVFDQSKVQRNESNPRKNPKNYKCVGKMITVSVGAQGKVTEKWIASAGVPQGTCRLDKGSKEQTEAGLPRYGLPKDASGDYSGVGNPPQGQPAELSSPTNNTPLDVSGSDTGGQQESAESAPPKANYLSPFASNQIKEMAGLGGDTDGSQGSQGYIEEQVPFGNTASPDIFDTGDNFSGDNYGDSQKPGATYVSPDGTQVISQVSAPSLGQTPGDLGRSAYPSDTFFNPSPIANQVPPLSSASNQSQGFVSRVSNAFSSLWRMFGF